MKGSKLRQMRMDIGWTQQSLADVLDISRSSLCHYEQERAPLPKVLGHKMKVLHRGIMKAVRDARRLK